MKTYKGTRSPDGVKVLVQQKDAQDCPLPLRLDLCNHSPTGFEWGYGGSGPAQLALALLADCLGDGQQALACHQEFKWAILVSLPHEEWTLTETDIRAAVEALPRWTH